MWIAVTTGRAGSPAPGACPPAARYRHASFAGALTGEPPEASTDRVDRVDHVEPLPRR